MPLFKKWSHYNKINVSNESEGYGIYELGDASGNILYIGEGHIQSRLFSHFIASSDPIPGVGIYRVEYTASKERAEQRERAEIRDYTRSHGDCPKFNDRLG